jgi:multidrug efflux pump subunit AcrA (membrane-fusion protein)
VARRAEAALWRDAAEAALEAARARARAADLALERANAELSAARDLRVEARGPDIAQARQWRADADAALRTARADARASAADVARAEAEAFEANRAFNHVAELDAELAQLDALMRRELNPEGGFTQEQVREGRRRWIPPRGPRVEPSGLEYHRLAARRVTVLAELDGEMANLRSTVADQVRAATPGAGARPDAIANARAVGGALTPEGSLPIDVLTGRPIEGGFAVDHIMSRAEISADPRFARLSPAARESLLLEVTENYLPMTIEANSAKGAMSMEAWIDSRAANGTPFPEPMAEALRLADVRARAAIEARFQALSR